MSVQDGSRSYPLFLLGLVLLGAGGLLYGLSGASAYPPRLILLAGIVVLVTAIVQARASLRFVFSRTRAMAEPGPFVTLLLLGLIAWVGAVGLGLRGSRIDLTARRVNSLSEASRQALAGLKQDVELIGAFRENAPPHDQAREVLAVYRAASRRIQTRMLDPDREPDEARKLELSRPDVFVVRAGGAREECASPEEAELTQAILRVEDPRRPVLGVLDGHGETSEERSPLTALKTIARQGGVTYRTIRLMEELEVPRDLAGLLVVGPKTALLPGEVEAVRKYVDGGGRLGVLIEPLCPTGLEPYLLSKGIRVDFRRVHDESPLTQSLGKGPETLAVNRFAKHSITAGIGVGVVLAGATGVSLTPTPILGTSGSDLLRSGPGARFVSRETDRPEGEPAVIPLGAVLEWEISDEPLAGDLLPERQAARLAVVGDSDFLRDGTIDLFGNRELAGRLLGWLTEREYLLQFPPVDRGSSPLRVNLAGLRAIFYGVEILLPILAFGLGFRAWARRR